MSDIHKFTTPAHYGHTFIACFNEAGNFAGFTAQTDVLNFSFDLDPPWGVDLFG